MGYIRNTEVKVRDIFFFIPGISFPATSLPFDVPFTLQVICLRPSISPYDVGLLVLKIPGNDDDDIVFPDPDPFLHLAGYPRHPLFAVVASHLQPVPAEAGLHGPENLSIMRSRKADSLYDLRTLCISLPFSTCIISQLYHH